MDKRLQWADKITLEDIDKIPCIYKIISPFNRIYIGSTINIHNRIKYYNCLDCKGQTKLYNSFIKYGLENHIITILEYIDLNRLYERENYWGLYYNVLDKGLNCNLPSTTDIKKLVSEETKIRMSESKKGIKNTFFGKTHSIETRLKISKAHTGRKHTVEHRLKVSKNSAKVNSKMVLDLSTGIIFESAKEASECFNIKHSTLRSKLNGTNKNTTTLIYI